MVTLLSSNGKNTSLFTQDKVGEIGHSKYELNTLQSLLGMVRF